MMLAAALAHVAQPASVLAQDKPPLAHDNYYPMLSPDGTRIVFASNRMESWDLFLMNADGSDVVALTAGEARDSQPAWSPDGKTIVFESRRTGDGDLYRIDADGSNLVRITNTPEREQRPFYTPNGNGLTYHATIEGARQVFILDAEGERPRQLTDGDNSSDWASWTSPNEPIFFESFRTGHWEIYSVRPDGSDLTQRTHYRGMTGAPMLSPDGTRIVSHQRQDDGNVNIVVFDRQGKLRQRLTDGAANDSLPTWSADGNRVLFCSDRTGTVEIFSVEADGSGLQQLTAQPAENISVIATALTRGSEAAIQQYREVKPIYPNTDLFPMGRMDSVGVGLRARGELADAIKIFELNVEAFPDSVYTHGSLAEAYVEAGNIERALEHLGRILEIDPSHAGAKKLVKEHQPSPKK